MPAPDPSPSSAIAPPLPAAPPQADRSPITISVLANDLNTFTPQGVAILNNQVIVPSLDGRLLQVKPEGMITTLANLLAANLGIPFGIVEQQDSLVVTVSAYEPEHYLVQVKLDGSIRTIADLTSLSGPEGAPFGVAVNGANYIVTLSTDVNSATSALLQVEPSGQIQQIADLSDFGLAFGVVVSQGDFIVAQEKGQLLRVKPNGQILVLADLLKAGLGKPFDITALPEGGFAVTTHAGLVVRVDASGAMTRIADLTIEDHGIPSGIAAYQNSLVVTTNKGKLLQIQRQPAT